MYDNEWNNLIYKINKINITNIQNLTNLNILIDLLIVAEDHRFKSHKGVDIIALVRAFWKTFFCKKREGASTIAMQLVRTIRGNYQLNIFRKISEIFLALKLTKSISKKEITLLYLSVAYYGWNMHGLEQACIKLNLNIDDLSLTQAASLIARLKYPEPKKKSKYREKQIKQRTIYILSRYSKIRKKLGSI